MQSPHRTTCNVIHCCSLVLRSVIERTLCVTLLQVQDNNVPINQSRALSVSLTSHDLSLRSHSLGCHGLMEKNKQYLASFIVASIVTQCCFISCNQSLNGIDVPCLLSYFRAIFIGCSMSSVQSCMACWDL